MSKSQNPQTESTAPPKQESNKTWVVILVAAIPVIGAIIVAFIQFGHKDQDKSKLPLISPVTFQFAGAITGPESRRIGVCEIQIVGYTSFSTDDMGSFNKDIPVEKTKDQQITILISHRGYSTRTRLVNLPTNDFFFQLEKDKP